MTNLPIPWLSRPLYVVLASVGLFIALALIASLLVGSENMMSHLAALKVHVVVGLLLLSLVNYLARAYRWSLFSQHLGMVIPLYRTVLYYFAGFALTTTPGKLGEFVRLWLLKRHHQYSYDRLAPLFIGDRLSDLIAIFVLSLAGLAMFWDYRGALVLVAVAIAVVTLLLMHPRLLTASIGWLFIRSGRWRPRLFGRCRRAARLTRRLFSWRVFVATSTLAIGGWLAECTAFYWLLSELGAPISFQHAVFIFPFAMLAGAVSMLPGGLGSAEATMLGCLVAIGVQPDVAVVATAVIRLTTLWFAVGLGFLVLPIALKLTRQPPVPLAVPEVKP